MKIVWLTALGVGGATVVGAALGFLFKKISHAFSDVVLAFAAGVMLAAAVVGLILPSLEYGGQLPILVTVAGIFCGALCLNLMDRLVPHLHRLAGVDQETHPTQTAQLNKVLLFVLAIAIHNLPEGMAVGVVLAGFLAGDPTITLASVVALSLGIAIQNFPEGAIISMPLRAEGMKKSRAFLGGVLSGIVEPIGAALTILAARLIVPALPYLLSFAAGAMLYVVVEELIPEMSQGEHSNIGTVFFAVGFCVMMILDVALG